MLELRKAVNSALSPSYFPHFECLRWKNLLRRENNSWKCQEGFYQNGLTNRLNSSQYYQYTECTGAAVHMRLQSSQMDFAGKGEKTLITVYFILFFSLSPTERALLTPSRIRQVKCAVFRQLLPLLFPSISPQGCQALQGRLGVPHFGSHKQMVPSAHCGSPASTSTTLTHSKIDSTSGHGNFVSTLF